MGSAPNNLHGSLNAAIHAHCVQQRSCLFLQIYAQHTILKNMVDPEQMAKIYLITSS